MVISSFYLRQAPSFSPLGLHGMAAHSAHFPSAFVFYPLPMVHERLFSPIPFSQEAQMFEIRVF